MNQARDLVRDLTLQGEDEIKLIAVMLGQFRTFTQVKILSESGQTESQIASSLGSFLGRNPNPYQIKFALRDARGLSLSFLKQAISYLIETDYQIKTGLYEKSFLFEKALLQIASQVNWNYFWNYNPRQDYLVVGFLVICFFYTQWKSKSKLGN